MKRQGFVFGAWLLLLFFNGAHSLEFKPSCGFPGKPYKAKISPEEKLVYLDGEIVNYQCNGFWSAPQERKCVGGVWTGPPARCGATIPDEILMRDARTIDMSATPRPREMWHHTNMTLIKRPWKYPNVFTSNRFPKARLRIENTHEYRWFFNFSQPIVKMYCKINFNFVNFTLQPKEVQEAHLFEIEIEVSPYRICTLQYQNPNSWVNNGNRVDTYFICESTGPSALKAEIANPPNYMLMRTHSSHPIIHELVAISFGQVNGNLTEPLCGEPEVNYGQSYRANADNRDYQIDCAGKDDWIPVGVDERMKTGQLGYSVKCVGDMVWKGAAPDCIPKKICPLSGVFDRMMQYNFSNSEIALAGAANKGTGNAKDPSEYSKLIIESISNYYHYAINDTVYATAGTELTYNCLDSDNYILAGKDFRKCRTDGTWSGNEPTCRFLETNTKLIESSNSLLIAIIIMGILLVIIISVSCFLFILYSNRLRKKKAAIEAEKAEVSAWQNEMNMYDNIAPLGRGGKGAGDDGIYELYERPEDAYASPGNEYTAYGMDGANHYSYTYAIMNDGPGGPKYSNEHGDEENDYVRMLRDDTRRYSNLIGGPVSGASVRSTGGSRVFIMRNDSKKRANSEEEPSYLEISK